MLIKKKITHFLKDLFPSTWIEIILFAGLLLSYGTLGTYLAQHYRIIFDARIPWDAYFSFDNKAIVMSGGSYERHPLSYYFFNWVRELSFYISGGKTGAQFRLTLAWLSNITISMSLIQVYKYLRNIINLPTALSLLLILFFAAFSTNILLSFTPETYTYTMFLLVLYNHYAAKRLQSNKNITTLPLILAGVSIGGLTVTNIVKVFIPVVFEKNIFKNWKKFWHASARVATTCIVFIALYLYRIDFNYKNILAKSTEQYDKFSNVKSTPTWDMIFSYFFGGSMLFPSFVMREKHNMKGFYYQALFMDVYTSLAPYLLILIILIMILWSYAKNFNNKLVHILMLSFLVDVAIHAIGKFGLHTGYIYGGHYIFVVPLLLGWLLAAYKNSPKTLSLLTSVMLVSAVFLYMNNFIRMKEFFVFINHFYR